MDMVTGTRRTTGVALVRRVLGVTRFKEMSAKHLRIAFDPKTKPFGQFVGIVRIARTGCAATTRTLYGSGTRCTAGTDEARGTSIWRVYNIYIRPELLAHESMSSSHADVVDSDDDAEDMHARSGSSSELGFSSIDSDSDGDLFK